MKSLITTVIAILCAVNVSAEETALTVYNSDLAVVRILDTMRFEKGNQTKTFTGVADRIDPTSVRFKALDGDIQVVEQNYRYDLVNSAKILERYIDGPVTLVTKDGGGVISGVLQSVMGDIVVKDATGRINIVKMDAVERYELPELPDGLITRPTLFWSLFSKDAGEKKTEVSYMTGGFSWHAEYSAVVSGDESNMDMSSWVSIENNSGASFNGAHLKLVAGEVNRAPKPAMFGRGVMKTMAADMAVPEGFEERGMFEYHLYDLGRTTDVLNNEIKQIALFDPSTVKAAKKYVYDANKNASRVCVIMEFVNSEKDGLGMALPAGVVRVYKRDTDASVEFVGEDKIGHTPKNETVRLMLGYVFDIAVERTAMDVRQISRGVTEQAYSISLRNRKTEKVTVTVAEHLYGDWEIVDSSHPYKKKDAGTAEFVVDIPADKEVVIEYRSQTKHQ